MRKTTRKPAVDAEDEKVVTTVGPNDNIFEALDLPNADEWLAKAELAREIKRLKAASSFVDWARNCAKPEGRMDRP